MAHYREDIIDIDLESGGVHRSYLSHLLNGNDIQANRFGVRLFRNGEPVTIDGATCMGYFIRHETQEAVTINGGTFRQNVAYVTLPEACYAVDGTFSLVIKLVGGGVTGTMRIIDGTVINQTIGAIVDPGSVVPDISDLMAKISRAEAAADTIYKLKVETEQISGTRYRLKVSERQTS